MCILKTHNVTNKYTIEIITNLIIETWEMDPSSIANHTYSIQYPPWHQVIVDRVASVWNQSSPWPQSDIQVW